MVNANLYSLLEKRFLAASEAVAFRPVPGEPLSYAGLMSEVARYANALVAEGVGPGDRITVQIEKSLDNVFLYLATLKAGAVYQPLNTAYTAAEVDYFISDAKPSLVVCDPGRAESLTPIAAQHGVASVHTMAPTGEGTLKELAAKQSDDHETAMRAGDDLAGLLKVRAHQLGISRPAK